MLKGALEQDELLCLHCPVQNDCNESSPDCLIRRAVARRRAANRYAAHLTRTPAERRAWTETVLQQARIACLGLRK